MLGAMALDMFSVLLGGAVSMLPAFIHDILHYGPEGLGILRAAPALGSIAVGLWLARQFLDYEPGIHWPQMQMQSGTTGINVPRIYNPVKQARDHDPHGHFVRRWLPALRQVPDSWLFEPWRMPETMQQRLGLRPGIDLPLPPVDLDTATRLAKQRLFALRARPEIKSAKAAIVEKHGSRQRNALRGTAKSVDVQQLTLDL